MPSRLSLLSLFLFVGLGTSLVWAQPEPERGPALLEASRDAKTVRAGKKLYSQLCASCHGPEGTGGDAPTNLFDAKWNNGGKPEQIWATINAGLLEKGMPPWQGAVAEEDLVAITAYLLSKKAP